MTNDIKNIKNEVENIFCDKKLNMMKKMTFQNIKT